MRSGIAWLQVVCAAVSLQAQVVWDCGDCAGESTGALPPGAFIGGLAFTAGGEAVVFDGEAVVVRRGGSWVTLWRPPEEVFGAFVCVWGTDIFFGESSSGTINRITQDGTASVVEQVPFVYDMAFDCRERAFVSAPSPRTTQENPRNGFYLLDLDPATPPDLLCEVPGYSGPLLCEPGGSLLVATAVFGERASVLRFSAETLTEGIGDGFVTEERAELVAADLPGAYDLAFGPAGLLLATDSTAGAISAVDRSGSFWRWASPEGGSAFPTYLAVTPDGRSVGVVVSDFATFNELVLFELPGSYEGPVVRVTREMELKSGAFVGGLAFGNGGHQIVLNGEALLRRAGEAWEELLRLPEGSFGSFVSVRGGEVFFGESTAGTISSYDLASGEVELREELPFNYDIAFGQGGDAFVSAPAPGSSFENPVNAVYAVDLDPHTAPEVVIEVPGYSGPIACDSAGNLYVATAPQIGPAEILRFSAEALQERAPGEVLGESDSEIVASELPAAYDLLPGPMGLLIASDFTTGTLWAVDPKRTGGVFPWASPVDSAYLPTYLAYDRPSGSVGVVVSDFATFSRLCLIQTEFRFRRGYVNDDRRLDLADAVAALSFLFQGGRGPVNPDRLDVNDDGAIDLADPVYLLAYLFGGGAPPPAPFRHRCCDPTGDDLGRP